MRPATLKHLHSAGGVLYRRRHDAAEIALIALKGKSVWTLPKGLIDRGEQPEATAVREIIEETGLTGRIVDLLGERSYWFFLKDDNVKCRKTVTYYLLEYVSGDIENYGWEVDEARWFPIDEAVGRVFYKSDREILRKAGEKIARIRDSSGPSGT